MKNFAKNLNPKIDGVSKILKKVNILNEIIGENNFTVDIVLKDRLGKKMILSKAQIDESDRYIHGDFCHFEGAKVFIPFHTVTDGEVLTEYSGSGGGGG
jgi:hypothetical protein